MVAGILLQRTACNAARNDQVHKGNLSALGGAGSKTQASPNRVDLAVPSCLFYSEQEEPSQTSSKVRPNLLSLVVTCIQPVLRLLLSMQVH